MIPYASFYYFFILIFFFIPIVMTGLKGKRLPKYMVFLTIVMILITFSTHLNELISLIVYIVWETVLLRVYYKHRKEKNDTAFFYVMTFLSVLPLIIVKISPFFEIKSTVGFLGISYLTFRSVQMFMDLRDGAIKTFEMKDFLSFLLFFPTISSGPIDRFKRFKKDIDSVPERDEYRLLLFKGINKIFLGFLYKFIIGYLINTDIIQTQYVQEHAFLPTFIYMYAYSLYLFFDFAGYSCFAIGVSYILGFKTPENFHLPFISRNIKDFWNRWHMSLSFWFRDYVYMRFIFLATKKKWIKNRVTLSNLGYVLLFLLMGLWHGLELHYIAYGLYHALLIIYFDFFDRKNKKMKFWKKNYFTTVLAVIITFHFICFGFLIFSGRLFI